MIERRDVERFRWEEVADDVVFPGAPEGEIRLRFALTRRRTGAVEETTIRLGPIALDASTYRVSIEGAPLDLTFKEFELLRYLAERRGGSSPGRAAPGGLGVRLLRRDADGRRPRPPPPREARAAHEGLIETVRGVGYRAADV